MSRWLSRRRWCGANRRGRRRLRHASDGQIAGRSTRFPWLFALAWAGGAVAYVPFLTILLPLRVVAIAGDDSVRVLGLITFFGALAASVGNILFGWLSDRSSGPAAVGSRRAADEHHLAGLGAGRARHGVDHRAGRLLAVGAQHDAWTFVGLGGGPRAARDDRFSRRPDGAVAGTRRLVRRGSQRFPASPMPTSACGWWRRWSRHASCR